MRISIPGNDRGNAVLSALILILVITFFLISMVQQINTEKKFLIIKKNNLITNIELNNIEVRSRYDIY